MMKYLLSAVLLTLCMIRVIGISTLPNGFYWDEMDNTYQAYSLIKTGKDMFGNTLPVLLHSFADYKSSLYIYAAVPFVKTLGMSPLSARAPAGLFGFLAILMFMYLVGKKFGLVWGLVGGIIFAICPWWFTYSRLSFEAVGMVTLFLIGLACLQKALTSDSRYLILSSLFLSLSIWTYSTAKLFIPLFGLIILITKFRQIWGIDKKILAVTVILGAVISAPVFLQSFFGKGNTRFNEVSIFTDPTMNSEVNYALESGQIASGVNKQVGMQPRMVDRLANNKYQFLADKLVTNYLSAFSTQFLFLRGDPNPRQSPGPKNIGQFLPLDFILIILGLAYVFQNKKPWILILWLALAPLSSIVTRDGSEHATRLIFLLPPLVFLATSGIRTLAKHRSILVAFLILYTYYVFSFGYYYFSNYRFESQIPFHWGFMTIAQLALDNSHNHYQVIVDLHHESDLMAFLVQAKYDPKVLQANLPLPQTEVVPGVMANKFNNIYILGPGDRSWDDYFKENKIAHGTLLILAADKKTNLPVLKTIYYSDQTEAFNLIEI